MSNAELVLNTWINRSRSEATKSNYESNTKEFFDIFFNKDIKEITADDLMSIKPMDIDTKYKDVLKNKGMKDATIKYKIGIVSQFMNKLKINKVFDNVDFDYIIQESLNDSDLKNDSEKRKRMSKLQLKEFQEWLVNERYVTGRYSFKGEQYKVLSEVLYVTGARITAVFNIKWSDIKQHIDEFNQKAWIIHVYDKGNKHNQYPITYEFYEKLRNTFSENKEFLFESLSQKGFTNDMSKFAELKGLQAEAFTPHSLRRLAITSYYKLSNDIVKTANFASHESIETTYRYIDEENDFLSTGSYLLSGKEITIEDIQDLSKEELLNIISKKGDMINYIYINSKKGND